MTIDELVTRSARLKRNEVPPSADGTYSFFVTPEVYGEMRDHASFYMIFNDEVDLREHNPNADMIRNRSAFLGITLYVIL
jgi:hypothetical protein